MSAYNVTVRDQSGVTKYQAIGASSIAVHLAALTRHGGLCSVVVIPVRSPA